MNIDMSIPKVTVIMPNFNGAEYIGVAIESILLQTFIDFELIVIDDASTDKSLEIIRSYNDQRIKLLCNNTNLGVAESRNKGLRESQGEYIAFLDSDDYSYPSRLAEQLHFMEINQDFGMIGSSVEVIDGNGESSGEVWEYPEPYYKIPSILLFKNYFAQSAVFARKSSFPEGFYQSQFQVAQDYDLWVRIAKNSKVWNLPKVLVKYRSHQYGISKALADIMEDNVCKIISKSLNDLGIQATEKELALHRAIANYDCSSYPIKDLLEWMSTIKEANDKKVIYKFEHLNQVLLETQTDILNIRECDLFRRLQHTQSELQHTQSELQHTRSELLIMQDSKFWKLRSLWTKLKQIINFRSDIQK